MQLNFLSFSTASREVRLLIYFFLALQGIIGGSFIAALPLLQSIPWYWYLFTIIAGGSLYFNGEGKTEAYTFRADHYAKYPIQNVPKNLFGKILIYEDTATIGEWSISSMDYHFWRGIEAIGIDLIFLSALAMTDLARWEAACVILAAVICYPCYKYQVHKKWEL